MFQTNVGQADRMLRVVAGLALIVAWFLLPGHGWRIVLLLLGVVALATGLLRTCPLYSLLGINTCPLKRD